MSIKAILSAVGHGIKSAKEKYEEERQQEESKQLKEALNGPGGFVDPIPSHEPLSISLDDDWEDADTVHLAVCDEEDAETSVEDLSVFAKQNKGKVIEI